MHIIKWFHHLLNPHCPDCLREAQENKHCNNCDVLQDLLSQERMANKQLLDKLINPVTKEVPIEPEVKDNVAMPTHIPWRVRKEMLEAEDRKKFELLREHAKATNQTTAELEKELGINHAS